MVFKIFIQKYILEGECIIILTIHVIISVHVYDSYFRKTLFLNQELHISPTLPNISQKNIWEKHLMCRKH